MNSRLHNWLNMMCAAIVGGTLVVGVQLMAHDPPNRVHQNSLLAAQGFAYQNTSGATVFEGTYDGTNVLLGSTAVQYGKVAATHCDATGACAITLNAIDSTAGDTNVNFNNGGTTRFTLDFDESAEDFSIRRTDTTEKSVFLVDRVTGAIIVGDGAEGTFTFNGTGGTDFVVALNGDVTAHGASFGGLADASTAGIAIENGTDPGSTCTVGEIYIDTDQTVDTNCTTTADNSLCLCTATNTWTALENN